MGNYKRLGDYIQEVNVRNVDLKAQALLGINIDKFFMPSVANIVGTDMSAYKLVKKNHFACNRMHVGRDYRLPISMSKSDDEFMVSPAYDVFEIKDTEILTPEYLMMWFSRREYDRNAWFYTDADVRGGLHWNAFCDMQLPIPSPTKQRELVKEYNVILNRIALNNQLIQKLEETAQTIYKQWFVDFEFPDEGGKPYKSSGGSMTECELAEIPKGWESLKLGKLVQTQYGFTASADFKNIGPKLLRITDISQSQINWEGVPHCKVPQKELDKYLLNYGDIVIARTGATAGYSKRINKHHPKAVFASYLVRMIALDKIMNIYLGITIDSTKYREFILANAEGSAQPQANAILMSEFPILRPMNEVIIKWNRCIEPVIDQIEISQIQNTKLNQFAGLLLSKLATIEN
jgi:type I restriction enzyme S subunit